MWGKVLDTLIRNRIRRKSIRRSELRFETGIDTDVNENSVVTFPGLGIFIVVHHTSYVNLT